MVSDEQIVDVEQGSPEWHAVRRDTLTGTRSAKVLTGQHAEVMREMVREHFGLESETVVTPPMENGSKMEPIARRDYREEYNVEVVEVGFVVHKEVPWLAFSPDGLIRSWLELSKLLEIKVPYTQRVYETIPQQYEEQCRIGMEVCDVDECDLWIWTPDSRGCITYHRDESWWYFAKPELEQFYKNYLEVIDNPELYGEYLEPKVVVRDDAEWQAVADQFIEAKAAHAVTKNLLDIARDAVVKETGGKTTEGCGIRASTFLSANKSKPSWRITDV